MKSLRTIGSATEPGAYWSTIVAGVYDRRAQQHRPTGAGLESEIRRLSAEGLTPLDVATALRLSPDYVLTVLAEPSVVSAAARKACA